MYKQPSIVALLVLALLLVLMSPLLAATITLPDGSSYEIDVELVSQDGLTFTYRVTELSGKDLSHLVIGICQDHTIVSASPEGYEIGLDGSTGFYGIKWNTDESFTSGTFTITLDQVYAVGLIDVLVKAGSDYAIGQVEGPLCILPPPQDDPPTETPTETPMDTPTETPTETLEPTETPVSTDTPTMTVEPTETPMPTETTVDPTETPTVAETPTRIAPPVVIITPTSTPTFTPTFVPTVSPTRITLTPSPTPTLPPPTNEEEGPEPKKFYLYAPLVSN